MAYVQVDVDLDDIELDDMFSHIVRKAKSGCSKEKKSIYDLRRTISFDPDNIYLNNSKVDEWKDELWPKIKAKFSLEQLEQFLNS